MESSIYSNDKMFPIIEYNGKKLPFNDNSFDIIISSNVLEHICDLESFSLELKRVCKADGFMLYAMPTHTWCAISFVTHYIKALKMFLHAFFQYKKTDLWPHKLLYRTLKNIRFILGIIKYNYLPKRHGERGNVFTEPFYFHPSWWKCFF